MPKTVYYRFTEKGKELYVNILTPDVFTKKDILRHNSSHIEGDNLEEITQKTIGDIYERVPESPPEKEVKSNILDSNGDPIEYEILIHSIKEFDETDRVENLKFFKEVVTIKNLDHKIEYLARYGKSDLGNKDYEYCQKLMEGLIEIHDQQGFDACESKSQELQKEFDEKGFVENPNKKKEETKALPPEDPEKLKLESDCEVVYNQEDFNLCQERDAVKHHVTRFRAIEKILKKKYADKNYILKPKNEINDKIRFELFWKRTFKKATTPSPTEAGYTNTFNIAKKVASETSK